MFPAVVLAGLEERYLDGQPLASYFDLIAGTSTGGIIALGLGAGLRAADVSRMYVERGGEMAITARYTSSKRRIIRTSSLTVWRP